MYKTPANPIEPFSEPKLLISIYEACKHRKSPEEDAKQLTDTIINRLTATTNGTTLDRNFVIESALTVLRLFDVDAAVQYAAFHKPD